MTWLVRLLLGLLFGPVVIDFEAFYEDVREQAAVHGVYGRATMCEEKTER